MSLVKNLRNLLYINLKNIEIFLLDAQYGNIDINQVFCSSDTISSHIHELADNERVRLKELLDSATKNVPLCSYSDLWTDSNRQCSCLGITASFVDDDYQLHNVDLRCYPFLNVRKTAENIIIVALKDLEKLF